MSESAPRTNRTQDIDLLDRRLYEEGPQETYAWLRANAPVYWDETNRLWGISRHADVVAISRDTDRFCSGEGSRPNTGSSGSMIDSDDPRHVAFRRVFARQITPRAVKQFTPRVQRIVDDLFDGLKGRTEFDLVHELAIPLPVRVILEALGLEDSDWRRYAHIAEITMAMGGGPRYQNEEGVEAAMAFYGEAAELAEQRREAPGEDWLSLIVKQSDEGPAARGPMEIAA